MMSYQTDPEVKAKVDELLRANAAYQAKHNCVTNSKEKERELNEYCNEQFLEPIKDIDPLFYSQIIKQND